MGCVILAFAGCNRVMALSALCIAIGLNAAGYAGYLVSKLCPKSF